MTNDAAKAAAEKVANFFNAPPPALGPVFNALDWWIVALFVAVLAAIVLYSMKEKAKSGKDYFLSGRDSGWLQIGSSIFSSNIGSEHLVGLAGAGFVSGMAMAHWEMQGWIILILGWVFVPLYDRMKVFTMPEFLELRFSRGSRNILSLLTIASLVLTKMAVTIYAGDVVIRTLLGINSVDILRLSYGRVLGDCARSCLHHRPLHRVGRLARDHVHLGAAGAGADFRFVVHSVCGTARARPRRPPRRLACHSCRGRPKHPSHARHRRSAMVLGGCHTGVDDHRLLVLVHRPVHRPARARRQEPAAIAARRHPGRLLQADAGLHFPGAGHGRLCADQRSFAQLQDQRRRRLHLAGGANSAARPQRHGGLRHDRRPDGLVGLEVQRLRHAVHDGLLPRMVSQRLGQEPKSSSGASPPR